MSCQATLFTKPHQFSTTKLLKELFPSWETRFDKEPTILPSADGMPYDFPRITLQNSTGDWKCDFSNSRTNMYWQKTDVGNNISLPEFYKEASRYLGDYAEIADCQVGRIAAVINRFAQHDCPGKFLANHFCKEELLVKPFNRSESFELHAHKKYEISGFNVNSWVRNKSIRISFPGMEESPAILVEQDLNTLSEEASELVFDRDKIGAYFETCVPEFDQIIDLYYSEQ